MNDLHGKGRAMAVKLPCGARARPDSFRMAQRPAAGRFSLLLYRIADMRHVWFVTLGMLLCLVGTPLDAQTIPSHYDFIETKHSIGLFGGYLVGDGGDLDVGPKSGPIAGARYNIHFTGPLSGEIGLGFASTQRTIRIRSALGGGSPLIEIGDTDALLLLGEAGLKFHLTGARTWRGLAPFGLVTIGFMTDLQGTDPREAQISEEQRFQLGPSFALSVGAGSDFFLTEQFSIRIDARDYLWRLVYPAELTEAGRRGTDWTNNLSFSLGGAIHF